MRLQRIQYLYLLKSQTAKPLTCPCLYFDQSIKMAASKQALKRSANHK
jgi:hypothetical protein